NNLLPGAFDTDRLRAGFDGHSRSSGKPVEDIRNTAMEAIPAGRFGNPREFGAICAFLCSVHASYIAGQNILADGAAYPGTF
ncbi:MAG TPA: SDR family oxidoreductase, partial [Casimicrobiaceae bacterium]|nr:SDR family oxidoreductase [Casimicrobiaceae bacterium]